MSERRYLPLRTESARKEVTRRVRDVRGWHDFDCIPGSMMFLLLWSHENTTKV